MSEQSLDQGKCLALAPFRMQVVLKETEKTVQFALSVPIWDDFQTWSLNGIYHLIFGEKHMPCRVWSKDSLVRRIST